MTTKRKSNQQTGILTEVIHCDSCGSGMVLNKANYVCPNHDREAGCPTTSVDAERLAHQLMSTLVNRTMTPKNLSEIVESIQQGASDKLVTQQHKLDETESAIEQLNSERTEILTQVEYGKVPYTEVAGQLESIEGTRAGLAYESAVSREEIDKLAFVSDQEAIQSVALDVATYTDFAEPKLAKQLVETFIEDIRVSATSCTVTYTHPIPGSSDDELITSESFPLP